MFTIIGIMLTGMLVGYLLRSKRLLWIHDHPTDMAAAFSIRHRRRRKRNDHQEPACHRPGSSCHHIRRRCRKRTGSMGTVVPCIYKE